MPTLRAAATASSVVVSAVLVPTTSAQAAGQYGDVRPTAVLRTIGGGLDYQRQGEVTAVSADGNTVVIGGGQSLSRDGDLDIVGHVWVWVRAGGGWRQQAQLSAPHGSAFPVGFGQSVSLSPDGTHLAIGDPSASRYPGIDYPSGAVYVYTRTATGWSPDTAIRDPGHGLYDRFGASVAISANGATVVAGAPGDSSTDVGSGAVWALDRSATGWGSARRLPVPVGLERRGYGADVALSGDGRHAAATDQGAQVGDQDSAGEVVTFDRDPGTTWSSGVQLTDQPPQRQATFGWSIAMSTDGSTLVVGSPQGWLSLRNRVAVFRRDSGTWVRSAQFFGYYSSHYTLFGWSVAVSNDGSTVAVGVEGRDSATAVSSGAVQRYHRAGATWSYLGPTYIKGAGADDYDGYSVALAGDIGQLFIGAPGYANSDRLGARTGAVYVVG